MWICLLQYVGPCSQPEAPHSILQYAGNSKKHASKSWKCTSHGNMPATHAYNNWQVNLFDRMVSTTYHWLTHSIFLFRVCLIINTQRTKLMSMLTNFTDYCREFWMCQDYIFSSKNRWYTTFPWIICISLKFDSSFLRMAIKYYFVTKTSFFFFI